MTEYTTPAPERGWRYHAIVTVTRQRHELPDSGYPCQNEPNTGNNQRKVLPKVYSKEKGCYSGVQKSVNKEVMSQGKNGPILLILKAEGMVRIAWFAEGEAMPCMAVGDLLS